jgi:hypothetical protein
MRDMSLHEAVGVGQIDTITSVAAKVDPPSAIFHAGMIARLAEGTSTSGSQVGTIGLEE